MVYHVSATPGLAVLVPRRSSHGKAFVYAVDNLVTGLLFGARHDDFDFLIDVDARGAPEVWECYPGAFDAVYRGRRCTVYALEEVGFVRGATPWQAELVCESPVPVRQEMAVPDLYARLLQEAANGALLLHRYACTPEHRALVAAHVADRLVRFGALARLQSDVRFERYERPVLEAIRASLAAQTGADG